LLGLGGAAVGLVPLLAGLDILGPAGDFLAWPLIHLPAWVHGVMVAVGSVGALIVATGVVHRLAPAFDGFFERLTIAYERGLRFCLDRRWAVVGLVAACILPAALCFRRIPQELFPEVDSSEFTLHLRLKGGPRVETTERRVDEIQKIIRTEI